MRKEAWLSEAGSQSPYQENTGTPCWVAADPGSVFRKLLSTLLHCRLSPGRVDAGAEPGRSRRINREEFAKQLQLSDPQTAAGAFSYFQQVKELGHGPEPRPCPAADTCRLEGRCPTGRRGGQLGSCTGCSHSSCWGLLP